MYFEIDEFLATLSGLTREQTSKMITLKQDELMYEVSHPKVNNGHRVLFRSFKFEISLLNRLGIEIGSGLLNEATTSVDRLRINNVLKNIRS